MVGGSKKVKNCKFVFQEPYIINCTTANHRFAKRNLFDQNCKLSVKELSIFLSNHSLWQNLVIIDDPVNICNKCNCKIGLSWGITSQCFLEIFVSMWELFQVVSILVSIN